MRRRFVLLAVCVAVIGAWCMPARAIVGGRDASPGEYPWMAAIYTGTNPASGQRCGASLVAPTVVVSAAHCVMELLDNTIAALPVDVLGVQLKVLLGRNTLNGSGGEQITVRSLHTHPDSDVDAVVLVLSRASAQAPIDWVRPGQESLYAAGVLSTVTGWGATSEGGRGSNTLKEAEVHIVSDAQCAETYGGLEAGKMVCAGEPEGGVDTCQGDSGGPLMVPDPNGRFILAGITSFGDGCARPNTPGVYTEVAAASVFIDAYA